MSEDIRVTMPDGAIRKIKKNAPILAVLEGYEKDPRFPILVAKVNNKLHSLKYPISFDCKVEFGTYKDREGQQVYRATMNMILVRAIMELRTNTRLVIGHSLGAGYYYDYYTDIPVTERMLKSISAKMQSIIEADDPIERQVMTKEEAIDFYRKGGLWDKVHLLRGCDREKFALYTCGAFTDIGHGPLAPSTGLTRAFELKPYHNGFILRFPDRRDGKIHPDATGFKKLFRTYHEGKKWGKILEVNNVGRLNSVIREDRVSDFIKVAEALHEKKIAQIADEIYQKRDDVRIVLIAGPSASGKTTFAKRLSIQLLACGLRPVALSLDDYFVDRDDNPRDEDGNFDFEHLHALDINLFNEHLTSLLEGRVIDLPKFSFEDGRRARDTRPLCLDDDQLLVIEGIHGLNDELTYAVPGRNKFKIFASCLTQLSIDDFNRIPTTDTRLLRRMVRDAEYRGYTAQDTIERWPSVRRGEGRWIFPFQEQADAMFNSALVFELSILKKFAVPLLKKIQRHEPTFNEARRLLRFFSYFLEIDHTEVPPTSIIREIIGDSSFNY